MSYPQADRPALAGKSVNQEIEVTLEMIQAGLSELSELEGQVSKAFLVEAVFKAMFSAAVPAPALPEQSAAGAPESEIEITPQMVAAGADVLWNGTSLDIGPGDAETIARRAIERALAARSQ